MNKKLVKMLRNTKVEELMVQRQDTIHEINVIRSMLDTLENRIKNNDIPDVIEMISIERDLTKKLARLREVSTDLERLNNMLK